MKQFRLIISLFFALQAVPNIGAGSHSLSNIEPMFLMLYNRTLTDTCKMRPNFMRDYTKIFTCFMEIEHIGYNQTTTKIACEKRKVAQNCIKDCISALVPCFQDKFKDVPEELIKYFEESYELVCTKPWSEYEANVKNAAKCLVTFATHLSQCSNYAQTQANATEEVLLCKYLNELDSCLEEFVDDGKFVHTNRHILKILRKLFSSDQNECSVSSKMSVITMFGVLLTAIIIRLLN